MSLPEFHHNKLTTALEQAIYSAHTNKNHTSSLTILILPDWKHTPYLARNLHTDYVQHIATIPHTHTTQHQQRPKYNLHIYLVANSIALTQLDATHIHNTLNTTLTQTYGLRTQTYMIDTTRPDATSIDSRKSYTNTIPFTPKYNNSPNHTTQPKMEPKRLRLHGRLTSQGKPHTRSGSGEPKNKHHYTHKYQITTRKTHD